MKRKYDYKEIGKRIKIARINKGITQSILAEEIDKAVQHVSAIERGISGISVETLMDICVFLEVDANYILFGK